jgi:2-keto-3-deoxy-6-phosphogluconate aldolase
VGESNVAEYLANPFVVACGASSIVDPALVDAADYDALARRIEGMKKVAGL